MQPQPTEPGPAMPVEPISPDLLAWARQTLDLDDILRQVREVEQTGGHSLASIIQELEARNRDDD